MRNLYKIVIGLVFQTIIFSCTQTNSVITPQVKPVVEAYLAANHQASIKVYTEIPYSDSSEGTSTLIDGLSLKLTGSNGKVFNLNSVGKGIYESATNELLVSGITYSLEFGYLGNKISASTTIPEKPVGFSMDKVSISRNQIDLSSGFGGGGFGGGGGGEIANSVELTWLNPNNAYFFVAVENTESNPVPIVILPADNTFPNFRFTNQPLTGTTNIIRSQSFQYFGNHDIILYRVNPDYAALYQSSGTTSQNLSTPPSSITNGMGIFTGINADTLKFHVNKL